MKQYNLSEAIHRFFMWLIIGYIFANFNYHNISQNEKFEKLNILTDTVVKQWNTLGYIGIILAIFTILWFLQKYKYNYDTTTPIYSFFKKTTGYILIPTFSTGASLFGLMIYLLFNSANNWMNYLQSVLILLGFFLFLCIIWCIHIKTKQEDLLNKKYLNKLKTLHNIIFLLITSCIWYLVLWIFSYPTQS